MQYKKKIFIIAGEVSGDQLGAILLRNLLKSNDIIKFGSPVNRSLEYRGVTGSVNILSFLLLMKLPFFFYLGLKAKKYRWLYIILITFSFVFFFEKVALVWLLRPIPQVETARKWIL